MTSRGPLRILVVDDSAYNRKNIADALSGAPDVEVVGKAVDGEEALRLAAQLRPDAITLDLEMPRMDGFTFLRILMARQPTPVIVVSSYAQKENVFKALELGAIDFVAKPDPRVSAAAIQAELLEKIEVVRHLQPIRSGEAAPKPIARGIVEAARASQVEIAPRASTVAPRHVVGIVSSTGGPTALLEVFSRLPERFPGVLLVAQHMPDRFTRTFAERLDKKGPLRVTEAQDGDVVVPRRAYVCPGRNCMELVGQMSDLRLRVTPPAPEDRYVPSGDRLLRSIAKIAGSRAIGIVLTGMGDDGVAGARAIRAAGGTIIAESDATAVVYGMPAAAVRAGIVNESLPIQQIGEFLALLA